MAHSFIQAHDDEIAAFEHFADANAGDIVLLIDTYDTEAAAHKVADLAAALKVRGIKIKGVRIDSGDLGKNAASVREILDQARLQDVTIFASGNIDEYALRDLIAERAPIDGFGIGTRLNTSSDAPYLDCAYKLQEYAGRPRRKHSVGKATWPGRKQVYRNLDGNRIASDFLTFCREELAAEALLIPVMRGGKRLSEPQPLLALREHSASQLSRLPESLRTLDRCERFKVAISESLKECAQALDEQNR